MSNGAEFMRRELMIRFVRAFDKDNMADELDQIAVQLRPKTGNSSRCCVYHDRAVIKYRLMALLGISSEEEKDETKKLSEYFSELKIDPEENNKRAAQPLTVCSAGCSGCPESRYIVTGNCRGCFARPCQYNCPVGAISVFDQVSRIDYSKCIKCGKCAAVCPFNAIIKTTVPCEEACPVKAIKKNENGTAEIDFDKCIFCGKCFNACPFSAIMERSALFPVMTHLKDGVKMIAMVAPAAATQFPGTIEQLFTAISKLGFDNIMEVALGAELTTQNEAKEFKERMDKGEKLMTTSCCPSYIEFVNKHLPAFKKFVSDTPTPMAFAARLVKEKYPDVKTVFIGPCISKRVEASRTPEVDYVLNFEELGAMLAGRNIDVISQKPWQLPRPAIATARNFAKSCGVTQAVLTELMGANSDFKLKTKFMDGIDKKSLTMLKLYASGKIPVNFLEVMACKGGCVNGPSSLTKK
ncbi:MAG: monomeric [FeFe] hydrogenase [Lentisphaeria bacterium]